MADVDVGKAIEEVEELMKVETSDIYPKVLSLLEAAQKKDPDNVEVLWRLARVHLNLAEEVASNSAKAQAELRTGIALAKRAVELAPDNYAPHKILAGLYGVLGDHVSTKEKIENSYHVRAHAQRGAELNPTDATLQHILGRFCYSVAGIGWLERSFASVVFGTIPTATYEDALAHFQRAHELNEEQQSPSKRNTVYLGNVCEKLKRTKEAREWFNRVLAMPVENEHDKKMQEEARKGLARVGG